MKERQIGTGTKRKTSLELLEPMQPDSALSAIIGQTPLPRSELIKRLWDYIHKNGLQDHDRRMLINADDKLKELFGGKSQVSVIELLRITSAHLVRQTV